MRERKRSTETLGPGKFVRFPIPVEKQLEQIAARESRTVANVIRILVSEGLKKKAVAA